MDVGRVGGKDVLLVDLIPRWAAHVGFALERERGVENFVVQRLFNRSVGATKSIHDELGKDTIALDAFNGVTGRGIGNQVAQIVELVAQLDQFGLGRLFGRIDHLGALALVFG